VKLDVESVRDRVQQALAARPRRVAEPSERVPAAVLLLFVYHGGEPHLVFTKKTETVPHHKGQFSFPGGIVETEDGSRVETALREAREEIGLEPGAVEVLGVLDDVPTATSGFVITPVVGLAVTPPLLRPDGREIERVIEVPLRDLLDPVRFREEHWERGGTLHPVLFFTCGEDVIWGATARILREFLDLVFVAGEAPAAP
jgi:8-oxo-dGTP pyrophosphatase MutT (NUDIX family)